MRTVRSIFEPRSIAVLGASQDPSKVGAIALANLLQAKFPGPIYPVNSRHSTVGGLTAYARVADLPKPVDLAVLCTPAVTIPNLVRECGEAGIHGLVILSAGFREVGAAGRALEESIRREARRFAAMRIVGPNCLGVIVPGAHLNASFATTMPAPGRVALISQSGALCTAILDWAAEQSLGFSHFVSVGNMLDVGIADLLDYLAHDPATEAVVLYVESIENGRQFMSAARACSRSKPIVAYKAGRFPESAQAAASHTGAMAGVDSVYDAAFERAGIVRVFDIQDLFDCAQLLARGPRVRGERLAIVTNAGGPGVMACDALLARHGQLARLAPETIEQLSTLLPPYWSHGNPVDVLGDATPDRYVAALQTVLADGNVDAALAILTPQGMTQPTETARAVSEIASRSDKPLIANWMGGQSVHAGIQVLSRAAIPVASTPNNAIAAFLHLTQYARNLEILTETPRDVQPSFVDRGGVRARLLPLLSSSRDVLYESEAKAFLSEYGIRVTVPRPGHSADEVVTIAREVGFPVVLKVVSPEISHKTDAGGVALNLANEDQVRRAYAEILANVARTNPKATVEAVSVQPMCAASGGVELIMGAKKDPVFGPVIMVGLGGIAAELFADRVLGLPPLNERLATHMLEGLRAWPLIRGYRGRPPVADSDCLIEVLLRFSCLLADFPEIAEFDANPVLVRGREVVALDARLVVDRAAVGANLPTYSHLAICPYPEDLVRTVTWSGGTLTLRPIKPEDEPLWRQLLDNCSRDTLRARFLGAFKIDHATAARFCFVDYDRELAVVAETEVDGRRRLIAVARIVIDVDPQRAEFAVLVGDAWQGKGLGSLLMEYCLEHIEGKQVRSIYALTSSDNARMLAILKRNGFQLVPDTVAHLVTATKVLATTE